MASYIYQESEHPNFTWDQRHILDLVTQVASQQGKILGKMQQFGFGTQQEAMLNALTEEITKSNEIEGEILNSEQVRSSLAKRLHIDLPVADVATRQIDGVVDTLMDAVSSFNKPLTHARLFGWHAALFPTGYSGMHKIRVGKFRNTEMQVVSSRSGRELVHYQAPAPNTVPEQMDKFLSWLNEDSENTLLKAAIAHLWFVIIHPFDDGNGRLARNITEMLLARSENTELRFYSMSAQIQKEKKEYYRVLERTTMATKGVDISEWLGWFFSCLMRSMEASSKTMEKVLEKALFWQNNALVVTNKTQRELIITERRKLDNSPRKMGRESIHKLSNNHDAARLGRLFVVFVI
jgi:Fic family protein